MTEQPTNGAQPPDEELPPVNFSRKDTQNEELRLPPAEQVIPRRVGNVLIKQTVSEVAGWHAKMMARARHCTCGPACPSTQRLFAACTIVRSRRGCQYPTPGMHPHPSPLFPPLVVPCSCSRRIISRVRP